MQLYTKWEISGTRVNTIINILGSRGGFATRAGRIATNLYKFSKIYMEMTKKYRTHSAWDPRMGRGGAWGFGGGGSLVLYTRIWYLNSLYATEYARARPYMRGNQWPF